jgi:hypothetical protein
LFKFSKGKSDPPRLEIRETLFGDIPWPRFLAINPATLLKEPWASFDRARKLIEVNERRQGAQVLRRILEINQLEPRLRLQAWHFLRELDEQPPREIEKEILGAVIEVGMPNGLDIVAAYSDHCARYYNFSGAGVVCERPNDSLNDAIDKLLSVGASVVNAIGPWKRARPAAPADGTARLSLLTPSGIHFGQGPMKMLNKDPMGGAILDAAFQLMQRLIAMQKQAVSTSN